MDPEAIFSIPQHAPTIIVVVVTYVGAPRVSLSLSHFISSSFLVEGGEGRPINPSSVLPHTLTQTQQNHWERRGEGK